MFQGYFFAKPMEGAEFVRTVRDPAVLVLDEITDPQNLGALLRTAACAGRFVLELPPDRVVRRQLTLPAQARAFLSGDPDADGSGEVETDEAGPVPRTRQHRRRYGDCRSDACPGWSAGVPDDIRLAARAAGDARCPARRQYRHDALAVRAELGP